MGLIIKSNENVIYSVKTYVYSLNIRKNLSKQAKDGELIL